VKCPSCKEVVLTMSERNGVEIDYCPQCRGVWLDRGELDKILEKSKESFESQNAIQNQNSRPPVMADHKDYYRHKRKKSFLEEIFD
jgi:Zn-finger nucleic acid-binding protein